MRVGGPAAVLVRAESPDDLTAVVDPERHGERLTGPKLNGALRQFDDPAALDAVRPDHEAQHGAALQPLLARLELGDDDLPASCRYREVLVRERANARATLARSVRARLQTGRLRAERDRYAEIVFRFFFGTLAHLRRAAGDPHPGNYLLLADGRVGFLDFGLMRVVDADYLETEREIAREQRTGQKKIAA